MSKQIEVDVNCPGCDAKSNVTLYRSIWAENPGNRELVMTDQINVVTCRECGTRFKIPLPFIYTNREKFFAVWWEPFQDPTIDTDSAMYAAAMGPDNYLATAPRVKDWEEFKRTITRFETGELKGKVGDPSAVIDGMSEFVDQIKKRQAREKRGCSSMILFSLVAIGAVCYLARLFVS